MIIRAKIRGFLIFWGVFFSCVTKLKIDCLAFGILTILAGCGMRNVFYGGGGMQDFFHGGMREGGFFYGRREGGRDVHTHN